MKTTRILRATGAALLSTAFLLALAPVSHADLIYNVTLTISSPFLSDPNGPFALDMLLQTGSNTGGAGNTANSVTLSNFTDTAGTFAGTATGSLAPIGSTSLTPSGAFTGSSVLTLTNGQFTNEFSENLNITQAGTISFTVDETTHSETLTEAQLGDQVVNDQFSVFIDTASGVIATQDSTNSTLVTSEIQSGATLGSVHTSNSVSPDAGVAAAAVPEPGSVAFFVVGAAGLFVRRRAARRA